MMHKRQIAIDCQRSFICLPNVPSEVPRTAGAPRALAREVPDGRGCLDWSVRFIVHFSLGVELRVFLLPLLAAGGPFGSRCA
jgi:hypothetical protein